MRGLKVKIFLIVAILGSISLVTVAVVQEINYMIMVVIGADQEEKTNLSPVENQGLSAEVLALKPIVERDGGVR